MADALLIHGLVGAPSSVLAEDGLITALDGEANREGMGRRLDGAGCSVHPGFIDLQVNGIDDLDFTADPSSITAGGQALARHGVTAYLPTIVSSARGRVDAALAAIGSADDGAAPIGLHVEGPFIAPARRGAHDPAHRRDPDLAEIRGWVSSGVRMVTLAPELPGALDAVQLIAEAGGVAAVGHTDADAGVTHEAIERGARYATHLFNAMPPLHHREPGPVGTLLADVRVTIGLIADGEHVHPTLLRIVAEAAAGRVSVVSDQVATSLGGARLADGRRPDGTLAGGTRGLDHNLRAFAAVAGREAALAAVTSVPARLLGLDDGRGQLRVGGRADLVLLREDLTVAATIVGGRIAYAASAGE